MPIFFAVDIEDARRREASCGICVVLIYNDDILKNPKALDMLQFAYKLYPKPIGF